LSTYIIGVSALDTFRTEWVSGHLDHYRATQALESAKQAERRAREACDAAGDLLDDDAVRDALATVERARRNLAAIEAELIGQFDRFCGVPGPERDSP
jgi:hypothetical protein